MEADYSLEKILAMLDSEDADALAAIYVKDEPSFDGIGEVADTLGKIREGLGEDNTLPVLANLLPTYAPSSVITSDYRNYVRTYLETVKPSLLMFDYYPYQANSGDSIPEMMVTIAIAKEGPTGPGWSCTPSFSPPAVAVCGSRPWRRSG